MSRRWIFALITLSAGFILGCSNQWRNAELGMSYGEVRRVIEEVIGGPDTLAVGGDSSEFVALLDQPGMALYFADAPSPLGPVNSIMSTANFSFLGPELAPLGYGDIATIRVAFIDYSAGGGCALMVDVLKSQGGYITQYFTCTQGPTVADGEYTAVLQGGAGTIALRSTDVDKDGNLKGVIQLRIFIIDAGGNDVQIGKFSTLVGFGS